ncbi:MFS transporter [Clostridium cellulovorans]|uniref:Major facilitator superfamily MFS_1 n=1 Tax=Clostridium cellulovorans (strain ATCC 35296 / DSM 3052 / OCM 3 / 743B) TaxID=573061 RepID=D9SR28_CLOC7|nr:MFS transporter [Clostridium cellulovorans]ADL50316.1 major facilitator superfamily MFS_1 [Clostridium cellulovorans 743B]
MKFHYKRTVFVGLAFLSICAFWQMYDSIIPLILKNTFGIGDTLSGLIMALDNILAIFLLPFFGALSDRCNAKIGRRTPFIVIGTLLSIVFMFLIPTADNIVSLPLFIIALGLVLLSMGIYRSPAVALMPDITPNQLRSKANAIINLMGAIGGILTLIIIKIFVKPISKPNYFYTFIAIALVMIISIVILLITIKERKIVSELEASNYGNPKDIQNKNALEENKIKEPMQPEVKRSLYFLLFSVFLWFMGYNAVSTAFTKYAQEAWSMDIGTAATYLLVATIVTILAYVPIGIISSKFGRKKLITFGIILVSISFFLGSLFKNYSPLLNIIFALIGIGWASINVNSYPMVVEISNLHDVGKYTGLYYTFSMSAQIITPILSGALLEYMGYRTLFPYATIFIILSFFTMLLVKHGDNKPQLPKDKLGFFSTED